MATKIQDLSPAHKRLIAYAHPLREKVFTILTERSASPAQMTRELGLPRSKISTVDHHTKKLVQLDCAELISERAVGNIPEKIYKATARALVETEEWEQLLRDEPAFAEYQLGRAMQVQLDDFILAVRGETVGEDENFHMSRTRRIVDKQGLLEMLEVDERSRREKDEVERKAAERRSVNGEDAIHVSDGMALFKVPRA